MAATEPEKNAPSDSLAERLLEIGRDCAMHMNEPARASEIDELLYDERALPK